MKHNKSIAVLVSFALVFSSLFLLHDNVYAAAKGLNKKSITLCTGQTYKLKLNKVKGTVKWSSSKKKVATVSSKGKVKAKKAGKAIIKAKVKKKVYKCTVKCEAPQLNYRSVVLESGSSKQLKLKGNTQKVKWRSSNKNIATVSSAGKITGKSAGNTSIVATVASGASFTCSVNVFKQPVETFTVTFDSGRGTAVPVQIIEKGKCALKPTDPENDEYRFTGWFSDEDCESEFDFSTPITSDMELFAGWTLKDNLEDNEIDAGDLFDMESKGKINVLYSDQSDVKSIDGKFTSKKIKDDEDATEVLNSASALFGTDFSATPDEVNSDETDSNTYYRFSPEVDDIAVEGSQIIITADENGNAVGLNSTYDDDINNIDSDPNSSDDEAESIAWYELFETEEMKEFLENFDENRDEVIDEISDTLLFDTKLVIDADVEEGEKPILAYKVTITQEQSDGENVSSEKPVLPIIDYTIYVYAGCNEEGEYEKGAYKVINNTKAWTSTSVGLTDLLDKTRNINVQKEGLTYRFKDTSRNIETYRSTQSGFLYWITSNLPGELYSYNVFPSKNAVSLHANMESTYDFYKSLGRKSYDNNGATVMASYDYSDNGEDFSNAYWSNDLQQFVFGNIGNFEGSLDVVGHEFTHAVGEYIIKNGDQPAGLTYQNESGALDEAYADIMGSFIENKDGTGRWRFGEDSKTDRDMSDPSLYDQPEHYNNRYTGSYDNGGVHINSGIVNFAAYKMMTDSRTRSITKERWTKVFYNSLFRLTTNAKFIDARGAILGSASQEGFTSTQQEAIRDAFDAVGITEPDYIKIVLTWGETPRDLDSHLIGPSCEFDDYFHIYYSEKNYYDTGLYYPTRGAKTIADLDYDDITSYGPEVTTIHDLREGEYSFFVFDYTNGECNYSDAMASSGAKVRVYRGTSKNPIQEYTINPNSDGIFWNVFKLKISADKNVTFEKTDSYSYYSDYYN